MACKITVNPSKKTGHWLLAVQFLILVGCSSLMEKKQMQRYYNITDIPYTYVNSYEDIPLNLRNKEYITSKEFFQSRNVLVGALSRHGNVGYVQETLIIADDDNEYSHSRDFEGKKDFDLEDDELYETDRYHILRIHNDELVTVKLIASIWLALWTYTDWSIKIYTPSSYIYLEIDRIYIHREKSFLQGDENYLSLEECLSLISTSGLTSDIIKERIRQNRMQQRGQTLSRS